VEGGLLWRGGQDVLRLAKELCPIAWQTAQAARVGVCPAACCWLSFACSNCASLLGTQFTRASCPDTQQPFNAVCALCGPYYNTLKGRLHPAALAGK
jgi:hypothetical protein